jgi:hypothetical protein
MEATMNGMGMIGRASLALALLWTPAIAHAADAPAKKTDAPELSAYHRTGHMESCLTAHTIRSTEILNDHQILFHMIGGTTYLTEADCPSLNRSLALSYDVTPDVLCNSTIVHLLDTSTPVHDRGTCGLSQFELLEKKK